ncbi:DNA gyrase subunit A [candidate division WWE3 bacterium CG08_land_8_20_14_0_20_40_13]|uniref:DNA gyrase subunit A n=1 Tax=candidate division WWE3 bacterium CG08_land_8_20_14_0_20_40_13 TaxID=1975084 RepID=A0A2H0XE03_UNCKA|nr:MAG: DNA gyrase subunit A [candidate division WWE3 bacterium CG08_land_8_20_14_0_20_40_13]
MEIIKAPISEEMKKAYLDYAMSVIVSRALPDVHDGLKPVQRRIIYAMEEQGMSHSSKYSKCAAVVGEVLKKYHPHGDLSVYDALVRMGQTFSVRYQLVDPQGNFGSVDGDPPAAMRYTECKLTKISQELLADIDKNTVDFIPNYSGEETEPKKLPSIIPNVLLNGGLGIAVGMATSIPTHNLSEVMDALVFMIDKTDSSVLENTPMSLITPISPISTSQAYNNFQSTATTDDLIKCIKGPDFPTGGVIYDQNEILQYFATGKGRVMQRAIAVIEEGKAGKFVIAITEIPYMVNKATLIENIANLVRDKRLDGISDIRDESDRTGMRVAIELKKDARPQQILNNLFKHTEMQKAFNVNMVALVNDEPRLLTMKMILEEFVRHRQKVVFRRTVYLLAKAREREHILQGLKIALDHIDEVIKTIRESETPETAKTSLMKKFGLSEIQSVAILDMQLRRLAHLERQKIEAELNEILSKIADYNKLISSTKLGLEVIKKEFLEIKEKYGDPRKTKIIRSGVTEFSEEELVKEEQVIVTISEEGYIKRIPGDSFKKQIRGGKGVKGAELKKEDSIYDVRGCSTHDTVLFFTNKGKVYQKRVWEIPEASRQAKGTPAVNLLNIASDEDITEFLSIPKDSKAKYLFFTTEKGVVKKTSHEEFSNIRTSGIAAISLDADDTLGWVKLVDDKDKIILISAKGKSIKFDQFKQIRPMGRTAAGVRGIRLGTDDKVVGCEVVSDGNGHILVVTENGFGKKTPLADYPTQGRGGKGVKTAKITAKNGPITSVKLIPNNEMDILITSKGGQVIRLSADKIATQSRSTQGVILMRLDKGDKVSAVTLL